MLEALQNPILFSNEKNDMKALNLTFTFGRFLLATPFKLEGKRYVIRGITIFLLISIIFQAYVSIASRVSDVSTSSITFVMVDWLRIILDMLFVAICLMNSNIFMMLHWRLLYRKLAHLDFLLRKHNFQVKRKLFLFYCEILLAFISFSALQIYELTIVYRYRGKDGVISFIGWTISQFYMNFILLLTYNFAKVLRHRYVLLNDMVKNTNEGELLNATIVHKLDEIVILYKTLYAIVDQFNKIFGWHVLLYISVSVMYILYAIMFSMEVKFIMERSIPWYLLSVVYILSLVILIISCDRAEKSGLKVISTCYLLHESIGDRRVKDKLLQLVEYAQQWKPHFSAAGFYDVNQSTLTAIFEAVITYLVILIQFDLALK
ncbi:hypothetical protein NQ318_014037 [Aromia moschata]|uniref:Gustatory receptor n=1 Tax=Aromia moschata TaxID=1265417 RepID=A0AAV8YYN6_9CUCU|nr:hypothetical protein NQ318_014037 [Aromia moschata]